MQSNFQQKVQSAPDPNKRPEIVRILIYAGLTLAINFIDNLIISEIVNKLYAVFTSSLAVLLISNVRTFVNCCLLVYLYRQYVFRSKKPLFSAVWILFGMQFARSILLFAFTSWLSVAGASISWSLYSLIANGSYYGVLALFYLVARNRLYLDTDSEKVLSTHSDASTDNDPAILGIDLEDINRRKQMQQLNRITGKSNADTSARRSGFGIARKLDLEGGSDRVIAQSSRDAIRVMEHKSLNMKHEWNCSDHDDRPSGSEPGRVIAKGNSNAIHVAEHSSLSMKHEWNCDDRGAAKPQSSTPERVIAPGSNKVHVTEHSKLNIRHEWHCDDQDTAKRINPSARRSDPTDEDSDLDRTLDQLETSVMMRDMFHM